MYAVNISAKFELRSLTISWENTGYCKNLGRPWVRPRTLFSQIFNGILFAWTLRIYLPNLKFVALCAPEIIGGTEKIWAVPGYAHAPFSPKLLTGFCFAWTLWIYVPNFKFVALRVPEIKGGTGQIRLWRHHWRHVVAILLDGWQCKPA